MASHTFSCIDGHTCGNPVRLVSGGGPRLDGADMLERRAHFLRDFDYTIAGDREVPDPYSLPDRAFEEVLAMVERATDGLVEEFTK